jgi:2,4-dienoyl-CoA reductase-like NADH-dependent reductase (Old Yellow Enzyme family)
MRSATAERMADPVTGAPLPKLARLYTTLAQGGVGLIVTGHLYVAASGKAHPEMAALDDDSLIPAWAATIAPAQAAGVAMVAQINHAGASCDPAVTPHPLSPSGIATNEQNPNPAVLMPDQIEAIIVAFGQAARRARAAGFDGVQLHGAHGYLISQFLSPTTNRRDDCWGGRLAARMSFLMAVLAAVREQVGRDYPVWIKLGVAGRTEHGFTAVEGARTARACVAVGADGIEISHALGSPAWTEHAPEPRYLTMAQAVRDAVGPDYPLALVNGFRTRTVMQDVLDEGVVQLISLCRPLIVEPDLPNKLADGRSEIAACARCSQCWPKSLDEGVACRNRSVQRRLAGKLPEGISA